MPVTEMTLTLYYDLISQPSRALYIVLKLSGIRFRSAPVSLRKGEQHRAGFDAVSKLRRLPVLHDNDFKLTESVAILRYLSNEKGLSEKCYPKDSKGQARVEEYLEWQHNNTRIFCAMYFRKKWMVPFFTGKELPPEKISIYKKRMEESLEEMQKLWLSESAFIAGDRITAADIWAACEIEQPRMAGYEPAEGRPILSAWLDRVRKETAPYYMEAHAIVNEISAETAQRENLKL